MMCLSIALGACVPWQTAATEINPVADEICWTWGNSLPTRSRSDTQQTRDEIDATYADFKGACPRHQHLLPE